jgi:hypothetical protein
MTDERRQRILQIAEELEAAGEVATNSSVYARALGHRGHVVQVMKERRAAAGGVAVAEAEDEDEPVDDSTETPAVVLAEDLRQLEAAYESWHLALEQIWLSDSNRTILGAKELRHIAQTLMRRLIISRCDVTLS